MQSELRFVFLVASFASGLTCALADDSFLDRPVPSVWVNFTSYQDHLQKLQTLVQKPLVTPEGMTDFMAQLQDKDLASGSVRIEGEQWGGTPFGPTVRDYLKIAAKQLGMIGSYDAAKDTVVLDFPWHVKDPRTNSDLMKILIDTTPLHNNKEIPEDFPSRKHDSWRLAFDALLSKPENFSKAWRVRFIADGMVGPFPGTWQPRNWFTGNILDEVGLSHFLILNFQPPDENPGESSLSYYLFDQTGKFEQGGLFCTGDFWLENVTTEMDAEKAHLTIHSAFPHPTPSSEEFDQVYVVEKGRFILKEILRNGKPIKPWDSNHFITGSIGKTLLTVEGN